MLENPRGEVMLITRGDASIRTAVKSIRKSSRSTQYFPLNNLGDGEKLSGIERIEETDDDDAPGTQGELV